MVTLYILVNSIHYNYANYTWKKGDKSVSGSQTTFPNLSRRSLNSQLQPDLVQGNVLFLIWLRNYN